MFDWWGCQQIFHGFLRAISVAFILHPLHPLQGLPLRRMPLAMAYIA